MVQQAAVDRSFRSTSRTYSLSRLRKEPSTKRLCRYTLIALLVAVISNIPIFLEFTLSLDMEAHKRMVKPTLMRMNENYIIFFKSGFEGIVLVVFPLVAMIYFNARIIYTLRERRRAVYRNEPPRLGRNETNLAIVLIAMDVVFLTCNIGRVIVNLWDIFYIGQLKECIRLGLPFMVSRISYLDTS